MLFLLLFAASCDGGSDVPAGSKETGVSGAASRGEALYNQTVIGSASSPGCITCHSLEEGVTLVGPSHAGIGSRVTNVVAGLPAGEYLEESIVNPNSHLSDGFSEGIMYANYARDLSKQEIDDLVAFMLSLK